LLDRFVEQGGTWVDTADCYAFWSDPSGVGGQSEAVIGTWLRSRPGARDRVRLSGHTLATEVIQLLRAHRGVIDDDASGHRLAPLGVAGASFILGG
jgi:aryl-alcohol dehydrogenase-like predicted oxidoreductase